MHDLKRASQRIRRRIASVLVVVLGLLLIAWLGVPAAATLTLDELTSWLAPHRAAWYALPIVVLVFVLLGLALVPVLFLIAATGVAFGPLLGPLYAMAGCLASASIGFAIGRSTGLGRIERVGGAPVTRVVRSLERNGTLAVFLLRKVPAPFLVANVVAGASRVRYRDFMLGTILGMGAVVVALAGFGSQMTNVINDPSLLTVLGAFAFVGVPLTVAWLVNRTLPPARKAA